MKIELLRGLTSKVSRSGGGNNVITCLVQGKPVEIEMPSVPLINDGDDLIVAGTNRFGTHKAHAFRNVSNGTSGHWDYDLAPAIAIVGSMLGLLLFSCFLPPLFIMALVCILSAGPYMVPKLIEKYRVYESYKAVMSEPPENG